jgi:hypothetical protein
MCASLGLTETTWEEETLLWHVNRNALAKSAQQRDCVFCWLLLEAVNATDSDVNYKDDFGFSLEGKAGLIVSYMSLEGFTSSLEIYCTSGKSSQTSMRKAVPDGNLLNTEVLNRLDVFIKIC